MEYYFSKILHCGFEEAEARTLAAMKEKGFGLITEINMQAKLKEKLGVDMKKYKILGMCSPGHAYKALQAEEKIGTMLPCNVLVIDREDGTTEISAVNPIASMTAITNPALGSVVTEVTDLLKGVVESL